MKRLSFFSASEHAGQRLDKFLTEQLNHVQSAERECYSRPAVAALAEQGAVTVNGSPAGKNIRLKGNEQIEITLPDPVLPNAIPQEIALDILYEDEDLLVVNKPQGMVVHPAVGNPDGTLVNALLAHCQGRLSGINGVLRPGIVHRIDKDTSGLLVVAKNDQAHQDLAAQIKVHSFLREYQAVVLGHLRQSSGTIDAPVGRHPVERKKMAVTEKNAKPAVTHYQVLEEYPGYSWVLFRLETGRTHQIRVHLSSVGHAIVGDPVYAPKNAETFGLKGQCLHAKKMGFQHPVTHTWMEFDSPLPLYFTTLLARLRRTIL